MNRLAGLLVLLLWPALCWGQCGTFNRVVVRERVVSHAAVVVETPLIVTQFAALPVFVPSYGAAYVGGGVPQQAVPQQGGAQPQSDMQALLTELRKINGRLDALEGRKPAPAQPMDRAPNDAAARPNNAAVALLTAKCAACHTAQTAPTLGNNFAWLDQAGPRRLTDREVRLIARRVKKGDMPPANNRQNIPPLSQEEANALLDFCEDYEVARN